MRSHFWEAPGLSPGALEAVWPELGRSASGGLSYDYVMDDCSEQPQLVRVFPFEIDPDALAHVIATLGLSNDVEVTDRLGGDGVTVNP